MAPAPPPPPPPICLPFIGNKPRRRLSFSSAQPGGSPYTSSSYSGSSSFTASQLSRHQSYSSQGTTPVKRDVAPSRDIDALTFYSDSEKYDDIPTDTLPTLPSGKGKKDKPKLVRSNTMTGSKKSKWGYGWGIGKKNKEKEAEAEREMAEKSPSILSGTNLPMYESPRIAPVRSNTKTTQFSKMTGMTGTTAHTAHPAQTLARSNTRDTQNTMQSHSSKNSRSTQNTQDTQNSRRPSQRSHHSSRSNGTIKPMRPRLDGPTDSSSTLVGSAMERKLHPEESITERIDTSDRLNELRNLMEKEKEPLQMYIVPSEDAHGSEYVSASDQRRKFISGFTGSAGQAIVTMDAAYLITDSRYWIQAQNQLDSHWTLVKAGGPGNPKDWIEWLVDYPRISNSRIGIDGRMISHEKAVLVNSKLASRGSKLVYPIQNLIDLVWKDKPPKSREPVFLHPIEFTGEDATSKIRRVRDWIKSQPPDISQYSRSQEAKPSQINIATLITSLDAIAWLLNMRGSDIPYNPLFHAYLFVGLDNVVLFLEKSKVSDEVAAYLQNIGVERRDYVDVWSFLRKREWKSEGKIIISPQTSYTVFLVLTHMRCTVLPSYVEHMMALKNEVELEGLRRAYLRDGVCYVRFLAWLDDKVNQGYDITEWEAAHRLTEFRRKAKHFMGLAYENISASGPNAALPHYSPKKYETEMISRNAPYLNDSGGQYLDGTCDTTRTVHFGRPDPEQCEAYTRVLQGHIAIDSAVFPEGTSGHQLDVLARRALWKDGLNYLHGTGHGFGSFLTVHEGPQGFSSNVPLVPGHVVTNEPGFYNVGKWGMRIESALIVRRFKTRGNFNGDIWLGFERLTCVPIQTRMVKESMLTKEEKQWLKDHNSRCYDILMPYLKDDKRAMNWLRRESQRQIGLANPAPGGLTVDWG
ncbi:Creatinase aminopeptidase [Lentinula edodes]|uniref:Creatinase aminopeptidase n=2 Tax=Lentinula edodes TaxID=5353 RepID=A0A1Q3EER3_LENED|nr:Creatinase aminopeptidase [Lentinula edodes]GAW05634.1 Creatinase aminopeptidase [Lentinula edodes]